MFNIHPPLFCASDSPDYNCVACLTNGVRIFRRPDQKYELYFTKGKCLRQFGVVDSILQAVRFSSIGKEELQ